MAARLETQQSVRPVRKRSFCYLCGQAFSGKSNDDHVPPKRLFEPENRNWPLILPTHESCNNDQPGDDQAVGQLIGLIHRRFSGGVHNKLKVAVGLIDGEPPMVQVGGLDLRFIIRLQDLSTSA